jgi:hypothetical protein
LCEGLLTNSEIRAQTTVKQVVDIGHARVDAAHISLIQGHCVRIAINCQCTRESYSNPACGLFKTNAHAAAAGEQINSAKRERPLNVLWLLTLSKKTLIDFAVDA